MHETKAQTEERQESEIRLIVGLRRANMPVREMRRVTGFAASTIEYYLRIDRARKTRLGRDWYLKN